MPYNFNPFTGTLDYYQASTTGSGIASINTDATSVQTLSVGTVGSDFGIVDNGSGDHAFNLPTASATKRGALSSTDWSTFNGKQAALTLGTGVATALAVNVGSAGAFVTFNGALGTPSSGTGTNIAGIPAANILAGTFGTGAYTMDTSLTVPIVIGGTGINSTLVLQSTSGGASGSASIILKTGANGAVTAMTLDKFGIVTVPVQFVVGSTAVFSESSSQLLIKETSGQLIRLWSNSGTSFETGGGVPYFQVNQFNITIPIIPLIVAGNGTSTQGIKITQSSDLHYLQMRQANGGGTTGFKIAAVDDIANTALTILENNPSGADLISTKTGTGTTVPLRFMIDTTEAARFDTSGNLGLVAKVNKYNGVTTAGWGSPAIYGSGRSTAQTGAVASVATYTVGAADGSFLVSANANITAFVAGTFNVTVAYTDETNTSRTLTLNFSSLTGTLGVALAATGPFEGIPAHIRCKSSTTITIATSGTFTSLTYNVEGVITQIT